MYCKNLKQNKKKKTQLNRKFELEGMKAALITELAARQIDIAK